MTKKSLAPLRARMREEGAEAAYDALMRVFGRKDASATALASAASSMLKAAGMMDKSDDSDGREPHEMTADELQDRLDQLRQQQENGEDEAGSVFD